ncbi:MAG: helix-turn-helix domain-containing protein [Gammaproteobacteria bacterium]|nr:helix-turn-helix domain-containing protein [Gammaproteobacteria bacterium]
MQSHPPSIITDPVDPTVKVSPRGFHERDAARYIGMSVSFLRKGRMEGMIPGRTPGPRWAKIGKRIIYLREDLDTWLDTHVVPQSDPFHSEFDG